MSTGRGVATSLLMGKTRERFYYQGKNENMILLFEKQVVAMILLTENIRDILAVIESLTRIAREL